MRRSKVRTFTTNQLSRFSVVPGEFWERAIGNRFWERRGAAALNGSLLPCPSRLSFVIGTVLSSQWRLDFDVLITVRAK